MTTPLSITIPSFVDRSTHLQSTPTSPSHSHHLVTFYSVNVETEGGRRFVVDKRYSDFLKLFQDTEKAGAFNNKRGADFHFPKKTFFVSNKPGQSELKNERRTAFEHMLDILNCEKESSTQSLLQAFLETSLHLTTVSSPPSRIKTSSPWTPAGPFVPYTTRGSSPPSSPPLLPPPRPRKKSSPPLSLITTRLLTLTLLTFLLTLAPILYYFPSILPPIPVTFSYITWEDVEEIIVKSTEKATELYGAMIMGLAGVRREEVGGEVGGYYEWFIENVWW
ncbi:hypothetical protein TrVE_jg7762 [Triparma verrucosa]|uniref:PX domain-containing protein n=1 Tax=Triparma verrucosa TaxID=1606542 RepID=A0A9W7BKR2_9STRA|nr:hypothetical protein TrVE_jg7762 [Triparma verrucosa]